jgi:multiple sugar transport system ATP-binding protein
MTLGDRVAVMKEGVVQQLDTPHALYWDPANLFVAAFIGSPPMNLVEAEITEGQVEFAGVRLPLPPGDIRPGKVILGIRPQEFSLAADDPHLPAMTVEPAVVEELGSETHAIFPIDAPSVDSEEVRATTDEGDSSVLLASHRRALFTASLPEGTEVVIGKPLQLALNPARLHFFDPETGARLDHATQLA